MAGPPYVARAMRIGRRSYVVISGTSPYVPLMAHRNRLVRDQAWFMLRMKMKYERWHFWRMPPPPVFRMTIVDVRGVDVVLGRLLALYAAWRTLVR